MIIKMEHVVRMKDENDETYWTDVIIIKMEHVVGMSDETDQRSDKTA